MTVRYKDRDISKQDILVAMQKFRKEFPTSNDYKRWLDNDKYTYMVFYEDYPYPPKYLMSLMTGMKTIEFKDADKIRSVFNRLGFATPPKQG